MIPHFNSFQVAGPYLPQYEVYYKKLDPDGKGEIGAMDAAGFLKKSGLPDDVLGKVKIFKMKMRLQLVFTKTTFSFQDLGYVRSSRKRIS